MGCGSSAAAVHSEAPLAREPLRATQRQQQRRPVYTEVVQCSGCGVHARVAFGVAFCDQCTTKLDVAAKIQQANIDSLTLNTTDVHSTTEVISGTDIDESELPAPPEQSVLNLSAPSDTKQEQSLENIKIPTKADALKSRFSQNGRAIYTIVETSEENSRTATPPPPITRQTTLETSEENSRTATQAPPITRQKKILSKSISITVEDRDTGIKEEIFQITLDHQTGQTYTFEETSTDANEKDIAQDLNSQEEANIKESENETPSNCVEAEDTNLDKKRARPEKQKRINEHDADTDIKETPEHPMHRKAADEPADEQQKEEEDTTTQSQHENTVASETHTSNSTGEPQGDRREITKEETEDKITKGTAKAEKSHNEETVDTTDAEESDDLSESSQEMAKKDSQAEESNEMAEAENSHNERKPDGDHSKSMMESVEGNENKRITVKISNTDSNENSITPTLS